MSPTRRPFGLAGAVASIAALTAYACAAPPTSLDGSGSDLSDSKDATESTAAGGSSTAGLPCAVSQVLAKECRTCHDTQPQSGASTSLVTYGDLTKEFNGKKVYELVEDKIHAQTGKMPPAAELGADETNALDTWIRAGAKESTDKCAGTTAPTPLTQPFNCPSPGTVTTLKASAPFTWTDPTATDEYVCFGVDEAISGKKHAIALGPMIQNPSIVHHVLLFQAADAMSNTPTKCTAATAASWKMVTGWAPGGGNFELPPEAGFPITGTTHWVLQVHYNNARALTGQTDSSGYQLCETDQLRPNDAAVLAFGAMSFTIPPRTSSFTVQCDYKLDDRYQGITFFAAAPHMHKLGRSIGTTRIPGGNGAPDTIFNQDPFSFEQQANSHIDKQVAPGDVMRTRCNWANPTDQSVSFGENTEDEMCFNFLAYYPAIPDDSFLGVIPTQSWVTPSLKIPLLGGPDCTTE